MTSSQDSAIQPCGYLLQLSPEWIVRAASENIHHFLGESHVTMFDEPLGRFVQAQPLHDLRNLFSRLSGTTGIARAYRTRLTDRGERFDLACQMDDGRVLIEAVRSPDEGLGDSFGIAGGLIAGLAGRRGAALLDDAARRMRALTGFDRAIVSVGAERAESSRATIGAIGPDIASLPAMIADAAAQPTPIFPRRPGKSEGASAVLRALSSDQAAALADAGIAAVMNVPIRFDGAELGTFECHHRKPRKPSFEHHAAAEQFAQMFALQLQIDRLRPV